MATKATAAMRIDLEIQQAMGEIKVHPSQPYTEIVAALLGYFQMMNPGKTKEELGVLLYDSSKGKGRAVS